MIQDIFLRWTVTALFVLSAAECVFAIATGRLTRTRIVSRLLHFIMSVAMVAMAWPWGAMLPTIGPLVFFLLAAIWFVAVGLAGAGHGMLAGYHAVMMLAMAWMYAVMGSAATVSTHADMPGMDMPSPASGNGHPAWVAAVDSAGAIGFAIAAVWWLYRLFAVLRAGSTQPRYRKLWIARQAMMAAGMAVMFGATL